MIETKITRRGRAPRILMREQNRIAREVAKENGVYWHNHFLQKHFSDEGAREYRYAKRQGDGMQGEKAFARSYQGRKSRKYGHMRPLEYSGETRRRLMFPRLKITATKGEAKLRIILNAPAFNYKNPHSKVNMRKEITTVSRGETKELIGNTRKEFIDRYNKLEGKQ